jgi:hypothetical protein
LNDFLIANNQGRVKLGNFDHVARPTEGLGFVKDIFILSAYSLLILALYICCSVCLA